MILFAAVISVLAVLKINSASGSLCASKVKIPVIPKVPLAE